jgi:hypothetical protein
VRPGQSGHRALHAPLRQAAIHRHRTHGWRVERGLSERTLDAAIVESDTFWGRQRGERCGNRSSWIARVPTP